jgi:RNA polymerase sigma factor (TIGR02999 family)
MDTNSREVTRLLRKWGGGADSALTELLPLIYDDLRRRARRHLRGRRLNSIGQATELVHIGILNLGKVRRIPWESRTQFINVVSKMMLHILVDHLRKGSALKRGGGRGDAPLGIDAAAGEVEPEARGMSVDDLASLRVALEELERLNERQSLVFSLRTVWGFGTEEAAQLLNVSTATVEREHRKARAFLYAQLARGQKPRANGRDS